MSFEIGNRRVGSGAQPFVIAEAGVNHNGDEDRARALVDAAAEAGADAVKFQTFRADRLASPEAPKAAYQQETTDGVSQSEMLEELEIAPEILKSLQERAMERRILLLSSPFDPDSVRALDDLGVPAIKVPSGEITNLPYLEVVASTGRPVILSTGMSTLGEVERALQVLAPVRDRTVVLHCVSEYPAPPEEINLRAMDTLRQAFQVPVGFSDHTMGTDIPIAAVARGAVLIEKHFTLDRDLPGPDHGASLEPDELSNMIDAIRKVHQALGSGCKEPAPSERGNRTVIRKSLSLARDGSTGDVVQRSNLIAVRPATGIQPPEIENVVGRRLRTDKEARTPLRWEDLS